MPKRRVINIRYTRVSYLSLHPSLFASFFFSLPSFGHIKAAIIEKRCPNIVQDTSVQIFDSSTSITRMYFSFWKEVRLGQPLTFCRRDRTILKTIIILRVFDNHFIFIIIFILSSLRSLINFFFHRNGEKLLII